MVPCQNCDTIHYKEQTGDREWILLFIYRKRQNISYCWSPDTHLCTCEYLGGTSGSFLTHVQFSRELTFERFISVMMLEYLAALLCLTGGKKL